MKKKKNLTRKNKDNKMFGFTLIELLAVIIILGVLMIIAIPSVTEYISSSRKNAYITSIQRYMDAASNKVNSLEYNVTNTEVTYYIPTKCIPLEKGGNSPFGDFEESYVVVTYDGFGYDYYYTGRDSANHGIVLTYRELLEPSYIETGVEAIDLTIGVGNRRQIIQYGESCNKEDYIELTTNKIIEEQGSLKDGTIEIAANENCFEFNSNTGTITEYICDEKNVVIPEYINGVKVTSIASSSFLRYNYEVYDGYTTPIYTLTIPKTITSIERNAIYSPFLYNIVNKTDKEFNWTEIIADNSEGDNTFVTGSYYALEINHGYATRIEITDTKVNYDLSSVFEIVDDDNLKIANKGTYTVNNYVWTYDDGWYINDTYNWTPVNNGEIFDISCKESIFQIKDNNKILYMSDLGYGCVE